MSPLWIGVGVLAIAALIGESSRASNNGDDSGESSTGGDGNGNGSTPTPSEPDTSKEDRLRAIVQEIAALKTQLMDVKDQNLTEEQLLNVLAHNQAILDAIAVLSDEVDSL
jgi:hypothetical protein